MSQPASIRVPLLIAALMGVLVWTTVCMSTGVREAWDADVYWRLGLPLFAVTIVLLAWRWPARTWSYGLVLMLAQFLPLLVSLRSEPRLLPLALAVLLALSVPLTLLALFSGWLARLRRRNPART